MNEATDVLRDDLNDLVEFHGVDSQHMRLTLQTVTAAVEMLPELAVQRSRDFGRGYAMAIKDVLRMTGGAM